MPWHRVTSRSAGGIATGVALVAACLLAPAMACAAPVANIPVPISAIVPSKARSAPARAWALDAAAASFARSGCLSCHGDPNLVVTVEGSGNVNFSIDETAFNASVHATLACTDCHTNFGYKPPHKITDWRVVAKQSCVNCKQHQPQFLAYESGWHAVRPTFSKKPDPKAAQKPLCGDCHTNPHAIQKITGNPEGKAAMRSMMPSMCGRAGCHQDRWINYNDYYHGAAFKTGAPDSPTCWDCHGQHTVLPSKDPRSLTNPRGFTSSCGKCHEGSSPAQQEWAPMIHHRALLTAKNALRGILNDVLPWLR